VKTLIFSVIIVFFFAMGLGALPITGSGPCSPQQEQSEKDKQKEKEKEKTKKNNVITDEDLKKIQNDKSVNITTFETDSKENSVSAQDKNINANTGEEKVPPEQTKGYWQLLKNTIVNKIQKQEEEIKKMEELLPQLRFQYDMAIVTTDLGRLQNEITELYKKIENYKRGLVAMKKEFEDLKDKARKAGIPPGWIR
jgi:hypothetical protein